MDNEMIDSRLRRLGSEPLPEHLSELPSAARLAVAPAPNVSARFGRRPLAAAAAVVAVAMAGGVSWAAANSASSPTMVAQEAGPEGAGPVEPELPEAPPAFVADLVPEEAQLPTSGPGGDEPVDDGAEIGGEREFPHADDPCKGPPEFVMNAGNDDDGVDGVDGVDGLERAEQARQHAATRAACEDDGDEDDNDGEREFPHADDPCKGPPEFVMNAGNDDDDEADANGTDGVDGLERAEQARQHAAIRAACEGNGDDEDEVSSADVRGRPDHVPGPPTDRPVGPPADRPVGDDADRPVGPPADRPVGPPEGVPVVGTDDRPSGSPVDTTTGPATDRPAGPPADGPGSDD